jgi:hypothetical protein
MSVRGVNVVGSANADLIVSLATLPVPGETVLADARRLSPGGKGLNQAIAAVRAGCHTRFVCAIGTDAEGEMLEAVVSAEAFPPMSGRPTPRPDSPSSWSTRHARTRSWSYQAPTPTCSTWLIRSVPR